MQLESGGPGLPGSLFQWSRATSDGVRAIGVWQSMRHFEVFLSDVIAPLLLEAGIRTPDVTTYDVHSYFTEGPRETASTEGRGLAGSAEEG
jgi:hypothetical protein